MKVISKARCCCRKVKGGMLSWSYTFGWQCWKSFGHIGADRLIVRWKNGVKGAQREVWRLHMDVMHHSYHDIQFSFSPFLPPPCFFLQKYHSWAVRVVRPVAHLGDSHSVLWRLPDGNTSAHTFQMLSHGKAVQASPRFQTLRLTKYMQQVWRCRTQFSVFSLTDTLWLQNAFDALFFFYSFITVDG